MLINDIPLAQSYLTKVSLENNWNIPCLFLHKMNQKYYEEAKLFPKWTKVMKEEIRALETNKTWEVTDLPPNKTAIDCKWVYKIKRRANGEIERYKARLVVKGYNYMETYSPMARLTTVRVILVVVVVFYCHLEQLDVNNAFLDGDL